MFDGILKYKLLKKNLDYFIKFNELRVGKEIKLIMDNKY